MVRPNRVRPPPLRLSAGMASQASMELRSERSSSSSLLLKGPGGGSDRISALPDDLLLLILAHLGCAATAARTCVLSRRWRERLWTGLREIIFRGVKFHNLKPALGRVPFPSRVSILEIHVPDKLAPATGRLNSLLRAAARLKPKEFVFSLPWVNTFHNLDLPCFRRATSIVLDSPYLELLDVPAGVEFPALENLSISAFLLDINGMLSRCPRLRVLRVSVLSNNILTICSESLRELVVEADKTWIKRVNIDVPNLKQLTLLSRAYMNVDISIFAPTVEKVSWQWSYKADAIVYGLWCLEKLSLQTAERPGELPTLQIHANIRRQFYPDQRNFNQEIEKHMVGAFSALELHLSSSGHVFGAFVLHLIRMDRICSAMRGLKIIIQGSTVKGGCPNNYCCDPTNWKDQTVSLIALEEMEIDGFKGQHHEFDFLKLVLKYAPILKRVIVKLSHEAPLSNYVRTELFGIFRVYSTVECCLSSGLMHLSQNFPST